MEMENLLNSNICHDWLAGWLAGWFKKVDADVAAVLNTFVTRIEEAGYLFRSVAFHEGILISILNNIKLC